MEAELRDYQRHATQLIKSLFREGHRSVLYVLPTGGGKTPVFCSLLKTAVRRKKRCAVFVHRRVLYKQAYENLKLFGLESKVPVITVQNKEYEKWALDFLVFDEAHHCPADTWYNIRQAQKSAQILGVTATPWRMDDKPLGNVFSAAVEGPSICDLVAQGWMVEPTMWTPPDNEPADDPVDVYRRKAKGLRCLVFTGTVKESETFSKKFNEAGIPSVSISGKTTDAQREKIFQSFIRRELLVICSCDVISEGFDVPCVEAVILLRNTDSSALYLQQVGRALRPHPDKSSALILDCVNNLKKHGSPLEERKWSLTFGGGEDRDEDERIIDGTDKVNRAAKSGRKEVKLNSEKKLIRLSHSDAIKNALKIAASQREFGADWAAMMKLAILRKKIPDQATEKHKDAVKKILHAHDLFVPLHKEINQ